MSAKFLQSKEWEKFQKSQGRGTWRIKGSKWQALILRENLPIGMNYLYCPGGPVFDIQFSDNALREFVRKTKRIAQEQNSIFLKMEPMIAEDISAYLKDAGLRESSKEVQPQKTNILDLAESDKMLLSGMHQKTRYNIGLAQKHGVKIYKGDKGVDIEIFLRLMRETSERDKFSPHSGRYYRGLLELPFTELFLAERDGRVLAAHILVFFDGEAIYLHGASDHNYRKYMAPYLLQWESIREAKRRGYLTYDFWGIDGKKWPGVTRFKRGFGGEDVSYVGSYNYVFNKILYAAYTLKQKL